MKDRTFKLGDRVRLHGTLFKFRNDEGLVTSGYDEGVDEVLCRAIEA